VLAVVGAVVLIGLPTVTNQFFTFEFAKVAVYAIALIGLNLLTGYSGQISLGNGAFMAVGGYTTAILVHKTGIPYCCLLYTSPSPRDLSTSRMPSSA